MMRLVEVVLAFAFGMIVMDVARDYRVIEQARAADEQIARLRDQCPDMAHYRLAVLADIHRTGCYCHYEPLTVSKFTPRAVTRKCER